MQNLSGFAPETLKAAKFLLGLLAAGGAAVCYVYVGLYNEKIKWVGGGLTSCGMAYFQEILLNFTWFPNMKVWMIQMMFPFKRGWFSGSSCSFSGVKNRWFPPYRPKPFLSAEGIPPTLMTSPSILSDGVGMWCCDVRYVITARTVTFLVGNPYKPWFATITGKGENPRYVFKHVLLSGWKKSFIKSQAIRNV